MARRKKGQKVDGWVILDKPVGITSTAAVAAVKRLFDAQKAGHGGTLDPLATGILPIALGEATKTVPYIQDERKIYRFTVRWGEATSTDDREGEVTAHSASRPTGSDIDTIIPRFTGSISQAPPAFSAIKVAGERAYDLARAGTPADLAERLIDIHRLALVGQDDGDHSVFEVETAKGAYVRALARDMGVALGTFGHVSALRRLAVGQFRVENSFPLDFDAHPSDIAGLTAHVLPIETVLDDIPALALTATEGARLRQGQRVTPQDERERERLARIDDGVIVGARVDRLLIALARIEDGHLRPVRIINR